MIADTADAIREGIARGYLSPADAIAWAREQVLDGQDEAVPLLRELAMAEHQPSSRILLMLGQLAWGAEPERVGRIAAGFLRERLADGRLGVVAVSRAMYHLMRDGFAPDEDFERSARRFDEEAGARSGAVRRWTRSPTRSFASCSGISPAATLPRLPSRGPTFGTI